MYKTKLKPDVECEVSGFNWLILLIRKDQLYCKFTQHLVKEQFKLLDKEEERLISDYLESSGVNAQVPGNGPGYLDLSQVLFRIKVDMGVD